jgi:hypothetical protein
MTPNPIYCKIYLLSYNNPFPQLTPKKKLPDWSVRQLFSECGLA